MLDPGGGGAPKKKKAPSRAYEGYYGPGPPPVTPKKAARRIGYDSSGIPTPSASPTPASTGRGSSTPASSSARKAARSERRVRKATRILHKLQKDDTDTFAPLNRSERKLWKGLGDRKRMDILVDDAVEKAAKRKATRQQEKMPGAQGVADSIIRANRLGRQETKAQRKVKKMWRRSGLPGKPPKTRVNARLRAETTTGSSRAAAWVNSDKKMSLSKATTRRLAKNDPGAKRLLLHEFAHTRQTGIDPELNEGLADLYAKRKARQLDIPRANASLGPAYRPFRKRAREETTRGYQLKGQFEPRELPRAAKAVPPAPRPQGGKGKKAKRVADIDKDRRPGAVGLSRRPQREDPKVKGRKEKQTAKQLKNAVKKSNRSQSEVPEIVPPQFRRAVAKHGKLLDKPVAAAGLNMTGAEYLAKLIEFESGWSPTAENPSSAYGLGQFIDSTAEDFRSRLGVETQDPKRPNQMIKGAAMHASGKFGYGALYAGYNPGFGSDPIPGVDVGQTLRFGKPAKPVPKALESRARGVLGKIKSEQITSGPTGEAEPQAPPRQKFLKHVTISGGLPTAEDLGVKNGRVAIDNIHPDLQRALMTLHRVSGVKPIINEGFRTYDYQAQLAATVTGPVAQPGSSKHESGLAVDLDNYEAFSAEDQAAAGLSNTMVANDLVHFQLVNEPAALVGPMAGQPASGTVGTVSTSGGYTTSGISGGTSGGTPAPTSQSGQVGVSRGRKRKARRMEGRQRSQLIRKLIAESPGGPIPVERATIATPARTKVTVDL